jgi:hypothetical protein
MTDLSIEAIRAMLSEEQRRLIRIRQAVSCARGSHGNARTFDRRRTRA